MGAGASQGGDDQKQQQQQPADDDTPQVHSTARDGASANHPTAAAKVKAVAAFGGGKEGNRRDSDSNTANTQDKPPPSNKPTKDDEEEDEDDDAAWLKEKEALQKKRKERLEREAREKGGEKDGGGGGAGGAGNPGSQGRRTSNAAPPSQSGGPPGPDDKPKEKPKKKLLNGTNIEYRYPSGSSYTGGFKDGKLHGFGRYKYHPSGDIYEGEWMADMKHGQGSYTYEGGDKYTGEWRAGKKHGKGTYIFMTGDEYIGSWKEDKIHGHGVFSIARNGNRYEGNWEESYRHGAGTLKSGNGDLYEGNWIRGKEEGAGVLVYSNGNIYAGGWRGGQMDGKGIMHEKDQKYTVEHIAGYLISKVPVEDSAVVDPDWNNANRLYEAHVKKVANAIAGGGDGEGAMAKSKSVEASDTFLKMKVEKEMFERKYQDLLAAKTNAGENFDDNEDEDETMDSLRKKLKIAKEERDGQKIRADDAVAKDKVLQAEIEELRFKLNDAENFKASSGTGGGGGGNLNVLDSNEYKDLQRRCADLERQVGKKKADAEGNGAEGLDPLEMKARLELQESELKSLKANREELKKSREQSLDNQRTIMGLETRNEELLKEITVQRQRAGHLQTQLADGPDDDHMNELRQLRKDVDVFEKEKEGHESSLKRAKKQAKDLEVRARKGDELEVEIARMRQSKQTSEKVSFGVLGKKSDELDTLRQQNAEMQRKLEELGVEDESSSKKDKKKKKSKDDDDGLGVDELKVKIEGIQSDLKKEKKKHKRAAADRDVYEQQLLVDQAALRKVQRQLHVAHGKVMVYALVRPLLPFESERKDDSIIGPQDQAGMVINRQSEQTFSFDEVFAETATGADLFVEAQPTVRKVVEGSHAALISYGPMDAGKTFYASQIAPLAIEELFASFQSSQQEITVNCTALELVNDGMVDLLSGSSDPTTSIEVKKNGYGVVRVLKASTNQCANASEALRQYTQALAAKTKSRSHFCFFLDVELKHKVNDAIGKGKLSLIDLCGPGELGTQTDPSAGKHVNNSMRSLASVISALNEKAASVPYLDDPLTTILSDVFGGNSRTHVFTHCSPSSYTANETMHSIGLAHKASTIYNRPLRQFETQDAINLRNLVKNNLGESEGQQKFYDITTYRE